jgi:hypothetical protein
MSPERIERLSHSAREDGVRAALHAFSWKKPISQWPRRTSPPAALFARWCEAERYIEDAIDTLREAWDRGWYEGMDEAMDNDGWMRR